MSLLHQIVGGVESALVRHQSTGVAIVSALLVLLVLQIALRDSRARRSRRRTFLGRPPRRRPPAPSAAASPQAPPASANAGPPAGVPPDSPSPAVPRSGPVRLRRPGEADDVYVWR